jgi:hypothetical protein
VRRRSCCFIFGDESAFAGALRQVNPAEVRDRAESREAARWRGFI